tara:strand:+ start:1130 stop:2185 length:1056 start_codon:yes stop_codon:yes gene_type:complete
MSNIKFNNVNKSFGSNKIIKNFNFEGKDDEFLVLVGPSGCGKSTLLRMIAGLEKIDEGEIKINENLINNLHPSKRETAMVFQSYALYPHMNVYENMSFGLQIEKKSKDEIKSKVSNAAKILKIEDLLSRKPKELSGGQRQRVAIGRAITRNPKIFLFDEPLSNLDAALRAEMRVEISKLHQKIKTNMIYVTHDQVEAMTLADRIVILNEGKIEQVGTPEEIYNNPDNIFVAQFIGTPKMNILEIKPEDVVSNKIIKILGNEIQFNKYNIEKKKYYIGIRPEHFDIDDHSEYEFSPNIDLVENLGNEKIVYMTKDKHQLSAKISSKSEIKNSFKFSFKNIFIFNENGERLRS